MPGVCARVALPDQDSAVSCSGCSGSAATTSGNGSAPQGAYVVHLAASAREPVNLWLNDSPTAFLHGSDSTVGAHRQQPETSSKPATQLRVAAPPIDDDPAASPKALEGCSFATHPVTLCFRDHRVQSLFDDQRTACARRTSSPPLYVLQITAARSLDEPKLLRLRAGGLQLVRQKLLTWQLGRTQISCMSSTYSHNFSVPASRAALDALSDPGIPWIHKLIIEDITTRHPP